ncbi:MAG TPA: glycosyltransferase [Candidatus Limnocylindrales bacterium]|nr:glycosyltransferase [Candidatus Limnocylindrales bacterium]
MHFFWTMFCGVIALAWILAVMDMARGVRTIPSLGSAAPLADADCPSVSILFAARDEAEKLPGALETFLALDYPRYEVIAVDDRSEDATAEILSAAAKKDARVKFVRLDSLPAGWLGKPHALQQAYEHSSGEWLVFTDADVHFAPDLLRRAIALARREGWEHLTLLGRTEMHTAGEKIALTFFGMSFLLGVRPWHVRNPRSGTYAGVGSFQLIRRGAYEAMGTHRRLAMEVVDDMKLGKLAKQAGVRSGVASAGDAVSVHWHSGVANIVRGTTKNFFATVGFQPWMVCIQIAALLTAFLFPFAALPFVHGWARIFDAIAVGLALAVQAGVCREFGVSPLYALTQPIGALIFVWMIARSTIVTLWSGGITWRGTFYPLEELKRGVV